MNYHCRTCASAWWPRPLRAQRKGGGAFHPVSRMEVWWDPWMTGGWMIPQIAESVLNQFNKLWKWVIPFHAIWGLCCFLLNWTNRNDSACIFNPLEGSFWEIRVSCTACSGMLLWDFAATRSKHGRNTFSWRGYVIENLMKRRNHVVRYVEPNLERQVGRHIPTI